jgi:hypothetical protein
MPDGEFRRFWCFDRHRKFPFSVFVRVNGDVDLLRLAIEGRISCDSSGLLLKKVRV